VLDFSTGAPWSNGTDYNYTSTRTAGTYVDSSGYIATSVANLCLQSEDFGTTWTNTNTTETTNTVTAPDGTTTADTLTESAGVTLARRIEQSIAVTTGLTYSASVYAKQNTATVLQISLNGSVGANEWANFNLSNGTLGSVGSDVTGSDATISNIGNGWYRCKLTFPATATGNTSLRLTLTDNNASAGLNPTYTVTAGNEKNLYLWGAQLVQGSEALPYSKTTTAANGIPRLTHSSSGTRLGLLVEEQRVNIAHATENFTNGLNWFGTNVTIADTTNTAPDNGADAESITEVAATSNSYRIRSGSIATGVAAGDTFTSSCFIKNAPTNGKGYGYVSVTVDGGTTRAYTVIVNLSTGAFETTMTVGSPTGTAYTIENYGNGWYRVSATVTAQTGATGVRVLMGMWQSGATNVNGYPTYTVTAGNEKAILAWGAQIEEGAAPTSYLANTATSGSGVTRASDNTYILDSKITSWQDPGALVIHFYPPGQAGTLISSDDGANTQLGIEASSTTAVRAFWSSGSTATGTLTTNVQKAVHYWNGTSSKFCLNAGTVQSGTNNITSFSALDFLTLGSEATDSAGVPGTYSQYANCVIRRVEWYGQTMTDAQLQSVTQQATYEITYLVIAGGGGGGSYGGGGAGGYRTATGYTLIVGNVVTVTVGGGGAGAVYGNTGSNSSLSGTGITTITSDGGGGGGGLSANEPGKNGGSGGGGGVLASTSTAGGTATSGQGYAGGTGTLNANYGAGGGGGSGGVGGNGTDGTTNALGGGGGDGTASSITGSSITRAGGGGGGAWTSPATGTSTGGNGGSGGGGNGAGKANTSGRPTAGSTNTGSGGGGRGLGAAVGSNGGSGVVILRIPAANYSGITTGAPTVTDDGSFKVLVYNSSGSYTA
jgi:hypothetical protein